MSYRYRAFFLNHKEIITSKLKELQREGAYQRDDYKELLNLVLMYLGENDNYVIHKPGATHKARWLMKLLHSLKIVILEESLPSDFCGRGGDKKIKINRFVTFFVFCYIHWWFSCPIATSAAKNDLLFYNTICDFELIDKEIVNEVKCFFQLHQWYIVLEMIPLDLFDKDRKDYEKDQLTKKIMS